MDGCMKRKRETHRTSFSPKYLIQNPTCLKQPVTRVLVLNTVTDQTNKVYKIEKTQVKLQKIKKKKKDQAFVEVSTIKMISNL